MQTRGCCPPGEGARLLSRGLSSLCLLLCACRGPSEPAKTEPSTPAEAGASARVSGIAGMAAVGPANSTRSTRSAQSSAGAAATAAPPATTTTATQPSSATQAASAGSSGANAGSTAAASGGGAGLAASAAGSGGTKAGCTRELLKTSVEAFYAALAAHSTDMLALAENLKYTENAKTLEPGEGIWKTAGMVKFKRTALDTETCMTATESVIPDGSTDRIYGLRLKVDAQGKISEIEAIVVLDYLAIMPQGLINSQSDDWETVLAPDAQTPRDKLQTLMEKYLKQFPAGGCGFAQSCKRLENGQGFGACVDGAIVTCNMAPSMDEVLKPRAYVIDVDAGIVVGFTVFLGGYDDLHLFKVRTGEVQAVHAVLTQTNSMTGWD